ncbi:MAG: PDZ domain-containing protein, partial [Gemmobacter sp.]
ALVTDVPDGPAKDAGVLSGDLIVSFDGNDIADTRDLVRRVGDADVGRAVRVVVMRDGKTRTLSITLGRRETAENEAVPAAAAPDAPPAEQSMLGLTVKALTSEEREALGLPAGTEGLVVTAVDESSEAFAKGLRSGDVITEAGQQRIASPADLEARITEARDAGRKSLLLLIRRGADPRFVALSID